MAITNAQQFKQLVNPPMKGKKRPGYRGDAAYGSASEQSSLGAGPGPGADFGDGPASSRDPMAQFSENVDTKDLTFMDQARKSVNPLGVLTEVPGGIGLLARILSPDPFRPKPKIKDFVGRQDRADDSQIVLPIMPDQAPSITEDEEDPKGLEGLRLAFRADGGPIGGEYDFESARQMYGLGKLVKKVTRSVKKIAKSPIGKAAIAAAGVYYLGGGAIGPFQRAGMSGFKFANLPGAGFFAKSTPVKLAAGVPDRLAFNAARTAAGSGIPAISGKAGLGIIGASVAAGLLTPEEEEQIQLTSDNTGIDPDAIREAYLSSNQYRARAFRAEGGSMKEPVAKKTMPLLDLDGKEMDLRAEGGFVPIGRMEKADDVPARLSKNEFVFTADAVRNAGDGNVDKGAEVMYNMMKNLEAGGDVSEESQGLEGASRMFQTSKRLEEVL